MFITFLGISVAKGNGTTGTVNAEKEEEGGLWIFYNVTCYRVFCLSAM
jgi:hypothetical protein